jgi:hypothetical protein
MEKRLRSVEQLPEAEASQILELSETSGNADIEDMEAEPSDHDKTDSEEDSFLK